jgi:hypothetical protein
MCAECWAKECNMSVSDVNAQTERERQHIERMDADRERAKLNVILQSREIDATIQVRTDIFNAATTAIVELKKSIDENESIINKPYALAEELKNRFVHYKEVIFSHNEAIIEAGNQQKAIQVYLNNLANSLRAEEREKLKIQDINYKPQAVKPVKTRTITTTGTNKKQAKFDMAGLKKYAAELGVAISTLQGVCIAKGCTPEAAADMLRKSIEAAKAQ